MSKQLGQLYRVSHGTRLWRHIDSSPLSFRGDSFTVCVRVCPCCLMYEPKDV
jgi:hypothetical protein